jgi:hypothetical protein
MRLKLGQFCPSARRIALVTVRSSSGTDLEGEFGGKPFCDCLWPVVPATLRKCYLDAALYGQGKSLLTQERTILEWGYRE